MVILHNGFSFSAIELSECVSCIANLLLDKTAHFHHIIPEAFHILTKFLRYMLIRVDWRHLQNHYFLKPVWLRSVGHSPDKNLCKNTHQV
jgi:hypothetical protein